MEKSKLSNVGRERLEFDLDKFDSILQFGPTREMCADLMGVSIDTIKRRIKEKHGVSFTAYMESQFAKTKLKLAQKALNKALKGDNTMLIFCLKNKLGWSDNVKMETTNKNIEIKIDSDDAKL